MELKILLFFPSWLGVEASKEGRMAEGIGFQVIRAKRITVLSVGVHANLILLKDIKMRTKGIINI